MSNANLFIPATKARNNFFELLEQVKTNPFPIHITVKGVPEVVLMSKIDFDGWMATIETLSDPELMEEIRQGDEDIKAGRYKSLEEVAEELGLADFMNNKKDVRSKSYQQSRKRSKKTR